MNFRSHLGIEKQIGSRLFKMVLHDTWTKASIFFFFPPQNCFAGCKWIQMSILELELATKVLKDGKFFEDESSFTLEVAEIGTRKKSGIKHKEKTV